MTDAPDPLDVLLSMVDVRPPPETVAEWRAHLDEMVPIRPAERPRHSAGGVFHQLPGGPVHGWPGGEDVSDL